MRMFVGPDALRPLVERAVVLHANHTDLPGHVAAALTSLDAVQLGDTTLAQALDHLGAAWSTALDCLAEDARTIVAALREVDARYVETEMATAASFTASRPTLGYVHGAGERP